MVRAWRSADGEMVEVAIENIINVILDHGPIWPWHGKDYLGAVVSINPRIQIYSRTLQGL